jgi:large subunit ribosomal protein L10
MPRPEKASAVAELTEAFQGSTAALLTEYRGLTVSQLRELRRSLAGTARYAVVKNTLTRLAARQAGLEALESLLDGPSAIAFVSGDPVPVAKGIRDFARTYPALVIKGGVLDQRLLSADEVRRLADLESREVLLAKLAGAMAASLARAAGLFAAPASQVARLAAALQQSRAEREPGLPAAESTAAAPGPTEPEAPDPEAEPTAPEPELTASPAEPAASAGEAAAPEAEPVAPAAERSETSPPS